MYLFTAAGRPDLTQHWVRRVLNELYTPDVFPGDEDNGEMSAWYILSALGLYPLCPGHPSWTLSAPLFPRAVLHFENGSELTIEGGDVSDERRYVQQVTLNSAKQERCWLSHAEVAQGGTLKFQMSDTAFITPQLPPDALPFSLSSSEE